MRSDKTGCRPYKHEYERRSVVTWQQRCPKRSKKSSRSCDHVLKTFAVSTFGALGVEAKQVIEAMVTEEVARSGFVADGVIMADAQSWLKSSIVQTSVRL